MKTLISAVLSIMLLFSLSGCRDQRSADIEEPVNFYYCTDPIVYNAKDGVLSSELREANGYTDDLMHLIELYLKGPVSDQLKSPFPAGIKITQFTQGENYLHFVFNEKYSELSSLDQTLARACFAKTIMDYTQVETIQISFESTVTGNRQSVTIKSDSILLSSESLISTEPQE